MVPAPDDLLFVMHGLRWCLILCLLLGRYPFDEERTPEDRDLLFRFELTVD